MIKLLNLLTLQHKITSLIRNIWSNNLHISKKRLSNQFQKRSFQTMTSKRRNQVSPRNTQVKSSTKCNKLRRRNTKISNQFNNSFKLDPCQNYQLTNDSTLKTNTSFNRTMEECQTWQEIWAIKSNYIISSSNKWCKTSSNSHTCKDFQKCSSNKLHNSNSHHYIIRNQPWIQLLNHSSHQSFSSKILTHSLGLRRARACLLLLNNKLMPSQSVNRNYHTTQFRINSKLMQCSWLKS